MAQHLRVPPALPEDPCLVPKPMWVSSQLPGTPAMETPTSIPSLGGHPPTCGTRRHRYRHRCTNKNKTL